MYLLLKKLFGFSVGLRENTINFTIVESLSSLFQSPLKYGLVRRNLLLPPPSSVGHKDGDMASLLASAASTTT